MITKARLIDEIRQVNSAVGPDWLGRFSDAELQSYLDHLQISLEPRGATSSWVRRPETPAVMVFAARE